MYLDKIEIHGFKSFGDSVKLQIPKGITAVIGPNGSGKSNVADAIRWVLGEQSAKTLRGNKMEDIIFAGTEKRKSLGYAEVSLHINNLEKELPIEYGEVLVKRRVYRSGESEYFLNGSTCRLKDIQELFMDTGIGKEGYSIIGQGQIDKILSSKPEDRRSLFEEAAGIYKYKIRRLEAEKKLEKQRDNLVRIEDIILEIENRLQPLETEANKTREYLRLKEQLKEIDLNVFINEIDRLKDELTKVQADSEHLTEQIEEVTKNKECSIQNYAQWKKKKQQLFEDIQSITFAITEIEKDQQKKYSEIAVNTERIANIDAFIKQIDEDTKNQQSDHTNMQVELQMLHSKKTGLELEYSTKREILAKLTTNFENMQQAIGSMQSSLEKSKQELYEKVRKIDWFKTEIDKKGSLDEQFEYRKSQINDTVRQLNSEIQHQEVHLKVLDKKEHEATSEIENVKNEFEKVDAIKLNLGQEKSVKKKQLEHSIREIEQGQRQTKWLEQIKNDYEGYYQSVKQVLNLKKQQPNEWQGIIGAVADLLEVPKAYEIAIVTALGSGMQYIVTQKEQDAKQMIMTMKQKGISRVTFLPRDTIQVGFGVKDLSQLKNEVGFLGLASELVDYEVEYEGIVKFLLGKILIVDEIKNASKIARKYGYKYKIVTLEGEVFNSGGSLSGGSSKNQKNNIFSRSRELKELKEKIDSDIQSRNILQLDLIQCEEKLQDNLTKWDSLSDRLIKLDDIKKEIFLEMNKSQESLKFTKQSQITLIEERNKIQDTQDELLEHQEKLQEELLMIQKTLIKEQLEVNSLEEELSGTRSKEESFREEMTQKKIDLSTAKQHITHIIEQIQKLEQTINHTAQKNKSSIIKKQELIVDKENILKINETLKLHIQSLETKIFETTATKNKFEQKKLDLESEEVNIEENLKTVSEQLELLKQENFRLETKQEKIVLEIQNYNNNIWEQYELTYGGAMQYKKEITHLQELKKMGDRVKAQIKAIGNVSVNAIEEFEETKKRYDFLTAQKLDIQKAEKTLLQMIDQFTKEMHDIFKEQFKNIATNFSEVFSELFGGGTAFLQFTDEDNILESGIEIIAKPPGKKLQNMTLLSGGERTLTAIALLFGILKLKPSPFCVLDEIEAALDDANVLRFANYLNALSRQTQFIVITHRKGTMERADTLYGVTMQERGVSKILSIKLQEATDYLDKKTS